MTYTVITSHPWQNSERELFERLCVEIVRAVDTLWEFETSLLLIKTADRWSHVEGGTAEDTLDAIEFLIGTWLDVYRDKLEVIRESVDMAHAISRELRRNGEARKTQIAVERK